MFRLSLILMLMAGSWKPLQPGVELAVFSNLYVVRIDPERAPLTVALASEIGVSPRTAAEWCRKAKLAVAINAGMFQPDQRSNVGYLRHGAHLNNARFNDYQSVLALQPTSERCGSTSIKPSCQRRSPNTASWFRTSDSSQRIARMCGRRARGAGAKRRSHSTAKAGCSSSSPAHRIPCASSTTWLSPCRWTSCAPCISRAGRKQACRSTFRGSISISAAATRPAFARTTRTRGSGRSRTSSASRGARWLGERVRATEISACDNI